jgi:hypothetical protein
MRWYVEYQVAGGKAQNHELTGLEQAVCGTAKTAQLRLPKQSGFSASMLQIEAKTDGVCLRQTGSESPVIEFASRTYHELVVPWEEDVFVGKVRFCFLRSESGGPAKNSGASGVLVMLLLAFSGLGVWGMFQNRDQTAERLRGPEAPQLWSEGVVHCPLAQDGMPRERLVELQGVAMGRMSRYGFDRSLGVEAVRMLEEIHACFMETRELSVRNQEERKASLEQVKQLKQIVDNDYRTLRLSLELARQQNDVKGVKVYSAQLLSLLALPQNHPYARWLVALKRDAIDTLREKAAEAAEAAEAS